MTPTHTPADGPTDDERMRAAIELAGESPAPWAETFLREHKVTVWGRVVPILIGATVVGAVIGYLVFKQDAPGTRTPVPGWRTALGWGLWIGGFIAWMVILVRARRVGLLRDNRKRQRPMQVLTFAQRKGLVRQVRGKDAVIPAQLPLLRHLATTMVGTQASSWSLAAVVTLLVGNALRTNDTWPWLFIIFIAVLTVVSLPAGARQRRQAVAFLAHHPTPTTEPAP